MAYSTDIANLSADHHWKFDGNSNDAIGSANGTDTSVLHSSTSAIAEDATYCATVNAVGDRVSIPATSDINSSTQTQWAFGGWFSTNTTQEPPKSIAGRGDGTDSMRFIMFLGNRFMVEADPGGSDPILQVYADAFMANNRPYHIFARWQGNTSGNVFDLFVDGVKQTSAQPADRQPDIASFPATTVLEFADPAGTVSVGGTTIILNAPVNGNYQHWCTFSGANVPSDTDVRETLFERGALADVTISSGTESAMQTALDVYASTARSDAPCCIEIEAVSGGGDFTLDLDNITFSDLASIHIRYNGTADTLTIRNTGTSNASIGAAPFGGTIDIVTEVTVKVTAQDATDFSDIQGARVLMEADTGGPLTVGTDIISTTTDVNGEASVTFDYSASQPVTGKIRKGSVSPFYRNAPISATITEAGLDLIVLMVPDE